MALSLCPIMADMMVVVTRLSVMGRFSARPIFTSFGWAGTALMAVTVRRTVLVLHRLTRAIVVSGAFRMRRLISSTGIVDRQRSTTRYF